MHGEETSTTRSLLEFNLRSLRLILHDEKAYPDPMSFRPERFLKSDGSINPEVQDPSVACYGFGRRCANCPLGIISAELMPTIVIESVPVVTLPTTAFS